MSIVKRNIFCLLSLLLLAASGNAFASTQWFPVNTQVNLPLSYNCVYNSGGFTGQWNVNGLWSYKHFIVPPAYGTQFYSLSYTTRQYVNWSSSVLSDSTNTALCNGGNSGSFYIINPPQAVQFITSSNLQPGAAISFTGYGLIDQSSNYAMSGQGMRVYWDFGDGGNSGELDSNRTDASNCGSNAGPNYCYTQTTSHTYANAGSYTVSFYVYDGNSVSEASWLSKPITITAPNNQFSPPVNFKAEYVGCVPPNKYLVTWQAGPGQAPTTYQAQKESNGTGWYDFYNGGQTRTTVLLAPNTAHSLRIRAGDGTNWSAWTTIGVGTGPCVAPP